MPAVSIVQVSWFRNRLVHGYFSVDMEVVWEVATTHAPSLALAAERALADLFPETYRRLQERRQAGEQ